MFFPLSRKRAFISQISLYKRHNNLFVYENSPMVSSYLNVYKRANNKAAKNKTERIPAGTFSSLTDPKERRARGSLTVEAALVLPIFLFAVMAILSFTEILRFQIKADNAISQCAKELAIYAYVTENGSGGASGDAMSMISGLAISETYVRGRVTNELTRSYIDSSPVKGGLYFLGSKMLQESQ